MSDQGKPNGAAAADPTPPARRSLREIAEDAYDETIEAADAEAPDEGQEPGQVDGSGQPRDGRGRFAAKTPEAQPGEAVATEGEPPSPVEGSQQPQEPHPAPAQPGVAAQAPQHWNAADRELFAKQAPEAQQFLLRRHGEMEADYQRRTQANATAIKFTDALAPVFQDPVVAGSIQQNGLSPYDAIVEWAGMHRRFYQDPAGLIRDLAQRANLDPAALGPSRSGPAAPPLSEQELKDPAIRYFADHISRNSQEVQALRGQLQSMQQAEVTRTNAEALKVTRWGIDSFAEEKGANGQLLRPDFDTLLPHIIDLFKANPQRDMREAYETARWMHPQTRAALVAAERATVQQQQANDRARLAARANTRGVTSPVSKPPDPAGTKSLRDTLEATADEIGL